MVAKGKTTQEHDEKIAKMLFSSVYLVSGQSFEKGRSEQELQEVITWLTGFGAVLTELIKGGDSLEAFFDKANLNPYASLIKGVICGYRIEDIETPLTKSVSILTSL